MTNENKPGHPDGRPNFTPLRELSPVVRRGILGSLEEDWPQMTREDKVNYLKAGGLDRCQAVGIEVPLEMLKEAGLA